MSSIPCERRRPPPSAATTLSPTRSPVVSIARSRSGRRPHRRSLAAGGAPMEDSWCYSQVLLLTPLFSFCARPAPGGERPMNQNSLSIDLSDKSDKKRTCRRKTTMTKMMILMHTAYFMICRLFRMK